MALNPTLIQGQEFLFPANKGSEFTYLRREDVKMKLYLPDRTIKEDGMIFLTSIRLVFIKSERSRTNANFISVELPLNLIEKPKFEQPVFGLNYLSGIVKPSVDNPNSLKSPCKWNIVFLNGQCSSFLNYFFKVYEAAKKNRPLGTLSEFNEQFFSNSNAYVDPSDPTFLYINEPNPESLYNAQGTTQNHYIPQNNQKNEDVPVYKRPYVPQHNNSNSVNNIPSYNQQNYMGNYDSASSRGSFSHQPYPPSGANASQASPNCGSQNCGSQNCGSQNYGSQNYCSPNYGSQNYCSPNSDISQHYNYQDNRSTYANQENTMSHYNQHSNFINYDQINNRNMHDHQNGNAISYNQRTQQPLHNQPNNQQFNPAYNEQFNNIHNQNNTIPSYTEQTTYQLNQKNGEYNGNQNGQSK
ncbi:hypothetical protein, conserved [Plasmodium gonderi]|uniref:Arabinogalactan protein n=1 Tax=Plasmodium gonderi TaxID=77519 RepID=A0A1Y1JGB8_PLAGO|nr:hypothetical protein, conserved [Plasmodium gonderi]GAW81569.1 hypothetical protein, conserved [Plasmodium gonderi]